MSALLGFLIGWRWGWRGVRIMVASTIVGVALFASLAPKPIAKPVPTDPATLNLGDACGNFGSPISAALIDPGLYRVVCRQATNPG